MEPNMWEYSSYRKITGGYGVFLGVFSCMTLLIQGIGYLLHLEFIFPIQMLVMILCVYLLSETWLIHLFNLAGLLFLLPLLIWQEIPIQMQIWGYGFTGGIMILGELRWLDLKRRRELLYRFHAKILTQMKESFALCRLMEHSDKGNQRIQILGVNPSFEGLMGENGAQKDYKSKVFQDLHWIDFFTKILEEQTPLTMTNYVSYLEKYVEVSAFPVGKHNFALLFTDVTSKLQRERELEYAVRRSEKADKLKTQFLKDVNHRLRTPLNGMMGMAQLIDLEQMGEGNRELFSAMVWEMQHYRNIINQIDRYVEIQGMDFSFTRCVPGALIEDLIGAYQTEQMQIRLQILGDYREQVVYLEQQVFTSVLRELISNGLKYGAGKVLDVLLFTEWKQEEKGHYFAVEVRDYGLGISKEHQDYLFNEFYHHDFLHIYKEEDRISLPMCRQMLVNIGGELQVASEIGKGSTFTMVLPVLFHG